MELPPALTSLKKGSFAYLTVRDRWPKIITKVVDQVYRYRHAHIAVHGERGEEDIRSLLSELSELRYHVSTDKPLRNLEDKAENCDLWNKELKELRVKKGEDQVTWYRCDWLFAETFLYRTMIGLFKKTKTLQEFDPFASQKQSSFIDSVNAMILLAKYLEEVKAGNSKAENVISQFFQICLWGNTCDLSLSCGEQVASVSLLDMVHQLANKILCNHIEETEDILRSAEVNCIDIVLDNAGIELFADLALAELLMSVCSVKKVRFHGKTMPWFVSDVTSSDFHWIIEMLIGNSNLSLKSFGMKCSQRLTDGHFIFEAHNFWTLSYPYFRMAEKSPDLYHKLSQSSLIIFKGDLNYRKLVGDLDWPLDTPFKVALQGFAPAPLLALRTLKAETVTGLSSTVINDLSRKYGQGKSWMVTGEYAVIQFAN
ncbi:unnamed protein product [Thelazia callipaeda]|uniref:Sugar phosphate phosphatase n=1 Tax=Thelazia callipaeda TaxID=103827 RepID=A0A0N5D4H4_THECL|nr:unnamed protein product [Thelazia callipaeda]